MKKNYQQCKSCRVSPKGHEVVHNGVTVIACEGCRSPFKLDRLVADVTGQPVVCECEGCKSRAARGRL